MHAMLASAIAQMAGGRPVRSRSITAFVTESQVARPLGELQARYPDFDIGSYPFSRGERFGTSLVARGTDVDALDALAAEIRALVERVGGEIIEEGQG
jgi:molybdopterin-biosynthesis enzyme MoeA-like protein